MCLYVHMIFTVHMASKDNAQQQSEEASAFVRHYSVKSTREEGKHANMRHLVCETVPGATGKGKSRCAKPSYGVVAADSYQNGSASVLTSTCGPKVHQRSF